MTIPFVEDEMCQLDSGETDWIMRTVRTQNRLILAVMLKFFQAQYSFPENFQQLPLAMITCLSDKFDISPDCLEAFNWNSQMAWRYRRAIRKYLGFRKNTTADMTVFTTWLTDTVLDGAPTVEQCMAHAESWLYSNRIEPVSDDVMKRLIHSSIHRYERTLQSKIANALSVSTQASLDALLKTDEDKNIDKSSSQLRMHQMKCDLQGTKMKYLQQANMLLKHLQQLEIPTNLMEEIPRSWLKKYALRASTEVPAQLRDHPVHTRHALMASFCFLRLELLTDQMSTALLKIIKKLRTSAEGHITREIVADVRRVNGKFEILHKLAKASSEQPTAIIQEAIYPHVSQKILQDVTTELNYQGKWFQHHVHKKMYSLFSHAHRRILFEAVSLLEISTDQSKFIELMDALKLIVQCKDDANPAWTEDSLPLLKSLPNYWHERIVKTSSKQEPSICRMSFEMVVFENLYSPLRSKAMWVNNAWRYRHPKKDLPPDFAERRHHYYQLLDLPENPEDFIRPLQEKMRGLLTQLNETIPGNLKVKILNKHNGHIKISPFDAQDEPIYLSALHQEIQKRWSSLSLLDLLKETDIRTEFFKHFHTAGHHENMHPETLRKKLLLSLYGIGSNTGLKRMSFANTEFTESDLRYIKRRYMHADNVREAIREVVNNILAVRDKQIWPSTTGCACDSTLLSSWDQNLLTEWHGRYRKRGVMIYWHVDKKSTCIYSQLKTCTSSEVAAMIKGVLNHLTDMDMQQGYVDTHGKSTVGFGICSLMHFDLLPRFKSIARQKLCYVNDADRKKYPHLEPVMKGVINWSLIAKYYDEMVQHIAALKTGIVEPEVLINRFSKDNTFDPVYLAFIELGKAVRTIFLCRYLLSEELRIEINESLNVVERLNGIMDFIFFGKLGGIATNDTAEQELSVLCLHLLQVSMVYINTLLIQEVLSDPAWRNRLTIADWRALSPLIHSHINPYGLFPLDMLERLVIGNASDGSMTKAEGEMAA